MRDYRPGKLSILLLLTVSFFSGCSTQSMIEKFAPETIKQAKSEFELLRHGQYDQIAANLDPSIDRSNVNATLDKMASIIPHEDPISVKVVGAHSSWDSRTGTDSNTVLEYQFPSKWLIVKFAENSKDQNTIITSFYVEEEQQSLEMANRFTFIGKTASHYAIFLFALLSIAFSIFALILCIKMPAFKHKWIWFIVIFLGIGHVAINWTTGELIYHIFYFHIPTAGMNAQLYSPWFIFASIPAGAILFIEMRRRMIKRQRQELLSNAADAEKTISHDVVS